MYMYMYIYICKYVYMIIWSVIREYWDDVFDFVKCECVDVESVYYCYCYENDDLWRCGEWGDW